MTQDPKKPADAKTWFPVRSIVFAMPISIPGAPARTELRGDIVQENLPRWVIEYAPTWRHHRITHYTTDPKVEPQVRMIPEAAVKCWEPMP